MNKSNSNLIQKVNRMISENRYDHYKNVTQKWDVYSFEKFNSGKISSLSPSNYSNIQKTSNFTVDLIYRNSGDETEYIKRWTLDQIAEIQIRINFKTNRYRKRFYVKNINMSSLVSKYCKFILKHENGKCLPIFLN